MRDGRKTNQKKGNGDRAAFKPVGLRAYLSAGFLLPADSVAENGT